MVEVASDSTDLITRVSEYVDDPEQVDAIRAAYDFAAECHSGQKRLSGDPYIVHPLAAATILADLYLDPDTIKAALLHDVIEDCSVELEELNSRFGPDVARLVDGVTKLTRSTTDRPAPTEPARRMRRTCTPKACAKCWWRWPRTYASF